jgi:hypothetical protein
VKIKNHPKNFPLPKAAPPPVCDGKEHPWKEQEEGKFSCVCGASKSVEVGKDRWTTTVIFEPPLKAAEPPKYGICQHGKPIHTCYNCYMAMLQQGQAHQIAANNIILGEWPVRLVQQQQGVFPAPQVLPGELPF